MKGPNYVIHHDFLTLQEFVQGLPQNFRETGTIIQDHRNILKLVNLPQGEFVVKYFKGMYFFNRLAYSSIRKSKAERSYIFSEKLNRMGVSTPEPVAWMDIYQWGLLKESFFVSRFSHDKVLFRLLDEYLLPEHATARLTLLHNIATLAFDLHLKGIYHEDFGLGNILVSMKNGENSFSLLDLNRIRFGKVSFRKGIRNFSKLQLATDDMNIVISKYAQLRGQPAEESIARYWKGHHMAITIRTWRRALRKYTLTPIEKLFSSKG